MVTLPRVVPTNSFLHGGASGVTHVPLATRKAFSGHMGSQMQHLSRRIQVSLAIITVTSSFMMSPPLPPCSCMEVAQIQPGQRVLDVACGTGVLTRAAARVGPSGSVGGEPAGSLQIGHGLLLSLAR